MKASRFFNHPDYDSKHIANDVALIELPEEVQYNGKYNVLYNTLQKHESTLLHMYVLNKFLTADYSFSTKYF